LTKSPRSDGAGEVVEVGSQVTRLQVGQRVVAIPYQTFLAGSMSMSHSMTGIGGPIDGVLREYGTFNEQGLVLIPDGLSYREAATLPCSVSKSIKIFRKYVLFDD
jgi:NADPH:quinone reductase-like Zn-dependent oxidoreductase